jgi:hypothetical protein
MKSRKIFKTDTIDKDGSVYLELLLTKFTNLVGRTKNKSINLHHPLVTLEVMNEVLFEVERSIKQIEKLNLSYKRQIQRPINLDS